jgi:hypothetical protein
MNPTGITLVFAFLVLLVVLGVGLAVTLSWRSILVATRRLKVAAR